MPGIPIYKDLYIKLLRDIYIGIYKTNDKFPTLIEISKSNKVAVNTVKKVLKMLTEDGFVRTDGPAGTFITYDENNPEHLKKMPFVRSDGDEDSVKYFKIPQRIYSVILSEGVKRLSVEQKAACILDLNYEIEKKRDDYKLNLLNNVVFRYVIEYGGNRFFSYLLNAYYQKIITIDAHIIKKGEDLINIAEDSTRHYIAERDAIVYDRFRALKNAINDRYQKLYSIPGLLIFQNSSPEEILFETPVLYDSLVHRIQASFIMGKYKKDEFFPGTKEIEDKFKVSGVTVERVFNILKKEGVIETKKFVGTKIILDKTDFEFRKKLFQILKEDHKTMLECFDVLRIFSDVVIDLFISEIDDGFANRIKDKLEESWSDYIINRQRAFLIDVIFAPFLARLPNSVFKNWLIFVHKTLYEFIDAYDFNFSYDYDITHKMYELLMEATYELKKRDMDKFTEKFSRALIILRVVFNERWEEIEREF